VDESNTDHHEARHADKSRALASSTVMTRTYRLRRDQLEWREVEGEVVALDVATARYLAVNRSGAHLWSMLVAGATREELVTRLVDHYDIPPAQAAEETDAFIEMLSSESLLEDE
jgi:hypothetical protein